MTIVGRIMGHRIKEETEKLPDGQGTLDHKYLAVELELEALLGSDTQKPSKAILHVAASAVADYPLEAPVRLTVDLPQGRLKLETAAAK